MNDGKFIEKAFIKLKEIFIIFSSDEKMTKTQNKIIMNKILIENFE